MYRKYFIVLLLNIIPIIKTKKATHSLWDALLYKYKYNYV